MGQPWVKIRDKDEVIGMVNHLGKEASNPPDDLSKLPEETRKMIDLLSDRGERKNILARLGVTTATKDNYRLVEYGDNTQNVMFIGHMEGDKFVADKRLVLKGGKNAGEDELLPQVLTKSFSDLPKDPEKTIAIPVRPVQKKGGDAIHGTMLELTSEEQKKLVRDVTLVALADQATRGAMLASASNAALPKTATKTDRTPG
jgi:hypothetical protein